MKTLLVPITSKPFDNNIILGKYFGFDKLNSNCKKLTEEIENEII